MKALVITYYWPPSGGSGVQRWMYFCKYLSEFGIEPVVLTVKPEKASYKFLDPKFSEAVQHVRTYRTDTIEPLKLYSRILSGSQNEGIPLGFAGEKEPGFFQKLSRWVRGNLFFPDARVGWTFFAIRKAKKIIREEKIDVVITTGPPHSTHLIGRRLKKKMNVKWVADFRDPWSEVYYNQLLYRTDIIQNLEKKIEKKVLNEADLVLTVGPSMAELLKGKTEKDQRVEYVYNGFEHTAFENVPAGQKTDEFKICHIGILGESQPITSFVSALKKLHEQDKSSAEKIKLQIIGKASGRILTEIEKELPWLKKEIVAYVPHQKAIEYMVNADLLLNSLAETENSKLLISGKLMEYLASGRPVLCIGNESGDAAELLSGFEHCKVISRSNPDAMLSFVLSVMKRWGNNDKFEIDRKLIGQYSRFETTRKLAEILKSI